jgi:UDP-N-acetylglucosamine 2-epimerase (non-hydrolysing)
MNQSVCFVVAARPNFMKAAPVLRALAVHTPQLELQLVHTGQHHDAAMSDIFLTGLNLPKLDVFLNVQSGTHAEQTARVLVGVEQVLLERSPNLVVVVGDVNSTLGAALAAAKLSIPVAHVEAGLRSFDTQMPEEHNRRLTDHLSSVLLAHSQSGLDNLAHEGIPTERVHLIGNTMIDTLLAHIDAARASAPWKKWNLEPKGYGLVTLHRPALVDDPALLASTVLQLISLATKVPLIFPVHPRTLDRLAAFSLDAAVESSNLKLVEPLGYVDFLGLEAQAAFVLTDSGGVQEETSALGVRCFTLRENTERPVTVELGTNVVLGAQPERIAEIPSLLERSVPNKPIPLWDGHAGERAATVLRDFLG